MFCGEDLELGPGQVPMSEVAGGGAGHDLIRQQFIGPTTLYRDQSGL